MMTGMPWTASVAGRRPVEFSQKKCESDCAAQEHVADMPDRTCRIQTSWAHTYTAVSYTHLTLPTKRIV